ncbi:MAG: hypothetical protein KI793_33450 [Rivularia sp. (in: Bacteria)]|nr:hypothetical protein [Rivularia sp. MS3]
MTSKYLTSRHSKLVCLISLLPVIIFSNPQKATADSTRITQIYDAENNRISTVVAQKVPKNLGSPDKGRRRGGSSR